jgi:hypothetical protein
MMIDAGLKPERAPERSDLAYLGIDGLERYRAMGLEIPKVQKA